MQTLATTLQEQDDDVLIQDTLDGNREAYGLLIQKYKDSLYDMACRILRNPQDAEDVLQEALTEAYRHLAGFNHQSRFSTWLYSIVLNRVRNKLRRNKTLQWYSLDASPSHDPEAPPQEMADRSPSVQAIAENKLTLEAVEKSVETLPFEYRTIFILHYMQDWPLKDVAEHLDRPVSTVKVYLHRARKLLYKKLSTQGITL